jgi:hypothetical protein
MTDCGENVIPWLESKEEKTQTVQVMAVLT